MNDVFINNLYIQSVRHLKNINIPMSNSKKKHLIITGKNGSGKTSLLEALAKYLDSVITDDKFSNYPDMLLSTETSLDNANKNNDLRKVIDYEKDITFYKKKMNDTRNGLEVSFNTDIISVYRAFNQGDFVVAFYKDERSFKANLSNHVEKINIKDKYTIDETPREDFVKYLVDLKFTQALAANNKKTERANEIEQWFNSFEDLMKTIFEDQSVSLDFNEETFEFHLKMDNREDFDFNTLSSGYGAVLDIIVDLMMRMEHKANGKFKYDMPGIVLIDEIETHLHLELQKNILSMLTTIFPNVQFIVSTHSPFVLNSIENVIIYDLENGTLVDEDVGLSNIPYDGVVEGYFNVETLSEKLKEKFEKYKEIISKDHLDGDDFAEIIRLQIYLEEIPDYLALDIAAEYKRLKLEFEGRKDLK
ncbi:MAG: AAA family ATPase [Erysipelotrichaceae bacterium]|nr:AAA family ATPase [Erysipelotrichaceae bacterium]